MKNIVADDPRDPHILPFPSRPPQIDSISDASLNERELVLHRVDSRHTGSALFSKNIKTAEDFSKWRSEKKEERRLQNQEINDKEAEKRMKICLVREELEKVQQHNKERSEQVDQTISLFGKYLEQRDIDQELLELVEEVVEYERALSERLTGIENALGELLLEVRRGK